MIQNIQKKKAVWKEALRGLLFLLALFCINRGGGKHNGQRKIFDRSEI